MLGFSVVQAGQELGRDISALVQRQREGARKNCCAWDGMGPFYTEARRPNTRY